MIYMIDRFFGRNKANGVERGNGKEGRESRAQIRREIEIIRKRVPEQVIDAMARLVKSRGPFRLNPDRKGNDVGHYEGLDGVDLYPLAMSHPQYAEYMRRFRFAKHATYEYVIMLYGGIDGRPVMVRADLLVLKSRL